MQRSVLIEFGPRLFTFNRHFSLNQNRMEVVVATETGKGGFIPAVRTTLSAATHLIGHWISTSMTSKLRAPLMVVLQFKFVHGDNGLRDQETSANKETFAGIPSKRTGRMRSFKSCTSLSRIDISKALENLRFPVKHTYLNSFFPS